MTSNHSNNLDAQVTNTARHAAPATAAVEIAVVAVPTNIFSKAFLQYAGERAIKTAAQVALAGGIGTIGFGVADVAWPVLASTVGLSALASVLTSVVTITGRNISD